MAGFCPTGGSGSPGSAEVFGGSSKGIVVGLLGGGGKFGSVLGV
jgi:hypothetical protein